MNEIILESDGFKLTLPCVTKFHDMCNGVFCDCECHKRLEE